MTRFSVTTERKLIWAALAVGGLLLPSSALAFQIVPTCATGLDLPGIDCILEMVGNVAQLILGVTGGLALIMFVYGGFQMLTSGGVEGKIKKGIETLKAAVVGIVIILMAGYLVRYGLDRLKVSKALLDVPTAPAENTDTVNPDGTRTREIHVVEPPAVGAEPAAPAP
ncbi:hypothetical protein COY93_03625 [Candidatus Uhrbacteria bacterium CG_4_10_14_0_8_um_filter_58_22]|uniref:Uncharacterized protein n=1 Tax=Candidatus Uhrbacteria bacterium CG_4_10_14_0_8_um_filter_58_22 TaxID=1975029 RepID=A0A2M7QAC8_9BACT|nr:MAG: hypothetical protein AUJ19_02600 [Parcubacteria group bacterium CG1_02_58_44]PIY62179.1 MAG: hypothetical protein COY93_03625 [Candidatus Uhrbacteria bacterium CG_4_10_14_0_8_um_filter_58_22]